MLHKESFLICRTVFLVCELYNPILIINTQSKLELSIQYLVVQRLSPGVAIQKSRVRIPAGEFFFSFFFLIFFGYIVFILLFLFFIARIDFSILFLIKK